MKKFLSILLATLMIVSLVPALLVGAADPASKATAITPDKNGRIYHYYETFDDVTATQGAAKVLDLLGWRQLSDMRKQEAHEANVTATEQTAGVYMYEIKDGKLYVRNRGSKNEYVVIADSEQLREVFGGAFAIEYTQTYLASSTSTKDGYVSLMYNVDETGTYYAESAIRISGWGNNRIYNAALDAGDVSSSVVRECAITDYDLHNDVNYTLYERLYGNLEAVPGTTNGRYLTGSKVMVDKELRVRLEFDGVVGPRVYVNDVLVSDPRDIAHEASRGLAAEAYGEYLGFDNSLLALCVTPGIDCVLDEITVYETRVASTPSLFITEVATYPDDHAAPYIEIYNGGEAAVDLADYVSGYVVVDANGKETVTYVPLSNYIGQSFNVGAAEIAGLAAEKSVLKPGDTVLLFPVDPAAPMTADEFRAEYALSAAQLVLPISGEDFRVDPTEYRFWFVATRLNDSGYAYNWADYSAKDMANNEKVESIVELVPSVAFGYGDDVSESSLLISTDPVSYHFGRGGDVQPGFSAHYVYGANFAAGARTGLMISRCTERIADAKNVGKLLDVQNTYFDRIVDFREGLYDNRGGLAITEFVPVTAENDAFECFEITNISNIAVDLYSYGLVSSGDAAYGGSVWTRATLFVTRPTATDKNPNTNGTYMVQPGASVVVWNKGASAEGKTVADFRAYFGLSSNVVVIVANCADTAKNVVAANAGTVSYGIAAKADIEKFLAGNSNAVASAVTDVLVPLHSLHYEVNGLYKYTWDEIVELGNMDIITAMVDSQFDGCDMVGQKLPAGTSLNGYFVRAVDSLGGTVFVACNAEDVVAANDQTEYFAPKDKVHFFAYGSKQDTSFPADYAVSFSYGSTVYAGKGSGSLMRAMEIETYDYDLAGRSNPYALLPYMVDVANRFITTDIVSGGDAAHSLGAVTAHQGVDVAIKNEGYYTVTYLDGNETAVAFVTMNAAGCSDVYTVLTAEYDNWFVNDVKYAAGETVMLTGNTVIRPVVATTPSGGNSDPGNTDNGNGTEPAPEDNGTEGSTSASGNQSSASDNEETKSLDMNTIVLIAVAACAVVCLVVIIVIKKKK